MTLTWITLSIVTLANAVWVGTIVFQSAIVAPSVFTSLDASDASKFLRRLFPSFFKLGIVCGVIMTAGFAFLGSVGSLSAGPWLLVMSAGMTVLAIISLALVPRINAARDEGEAGAARFESLHRLSVLLTVLILLAGIVVLVLIAGLAAAQ